VSILLEPLEALAKARQDWERDLRPLLGEFVEWEIGKML
jgi:hypothetical protein